jgi:hypothetical protein
MADFYRRKKAASWQASKEGESEKCKENEIKNR